MAVTCSSARVFSTSSLHSRSITSSRCSLISISVMVLPRNTRDATKSFIKAGVKVLLPPPTIVIR